MKRNSPLKQWKRPTKSKDQKAWLVWVHDQPCCVENSDCWGSIQAHHLTSGGRRIGDLASIALCHGHHHWDSPLPMGDAFGKGAKPWLQKHGSQIEMLGAMRERWFDEFQTKPWENGAQQDN